MVTCLCFLFPGRIQADRQGGFCRPRLGHQAARAGPRTPGGGGRQRPGERPHALHHDPVSGSIHRRASMGAARIQFQLKCYAQWSSWTFVFLPGWGGGNVGDKQNLWTCGLASPFLSGIIGECARDVARCVCMLDHSERRSSPES